jgi:hypothetical protein
VSFSGGLVLRWRMALISEFQRVVAKVAEGFTLKGVNPRG